MKNNLLSRYKVKQRRKKGPAVRLDFSCRHDDELDLLLEKNVPLFACCAEKMYDEVWPRWRMYGIVQVSLRTLHADEMSEINAEFRKIDAPTDVLTFPMYEQNGVFVPEERLLPILLGDIVLCPAEIRKNAAAHNVTVLSELALVVFHGLLHLLAWDHDTPEKEKNMWNVQERYRDRFLAESDNNVEKRS